MRGYLCFGFGFIVLISMPLQAGQLFPPENAAECGPGTHLSWNGEGANVRCEMNEQAGASWVRESLDGTELFDMKCEYRMTITTPSCMMGNKGYLYATYVDTTNIQHGRDIYDMMIVSNNRRKLKWWVEQVPTFYYCDVGVIEKRCSPTM